MEPSDQLMASVRTKEVKVAGRRLILRSPEDVDYVQALRVHKSNHRGRSWRRWTAIMLVMKDLDNPALDVQGIRNQLDEETLSDEQIEEILDGSEEEG